MSNTDSQNSSRPERAKPLQPDRPWQADETLSEGHSEDERREQERESAEKLRKQSEAALENVREGYD